MSEDTRTSLRRRWKDPLFVNSLAIPLDTHPASAQLKDLDLRGVPKLANGDPLWHFQIHSADAHNIDLSHGDGALIVWGSTVVQLICDDFQFDRASAIRRSTVSDSSFRGAELKFTAEDTEFLNCIFTETMFAGGFNEYGFRRCKFSACDFTSAKWQSTYFRACQFDQCDFTDTVIAGSIIAGFKYQNLLNFTPEVFQECEIQGIKESS